MNIVFFTSAHNSLSQRAFVELVDRGHRVVVVIATCEAVMLEAVEREQPDLIVAPMLKKVIPASIWQNHLCLIIHPGIKGDRGPSSLDWAILNACEEWGVTLLQANAEMDAGWITHLKQQGYADQVSFKLPAMQVLGDSLASVPDASLAVDHSYKGQTYREIWYEESQEVGYLHFEFYNGAMSMDQCRRLRAAFLRIRKRPTKVIVLMGGKDFWSNGIHLNVIEAAADPAHESWRNIHAMNDLVRDIITTNSHLVIAAMRGNAAAGGVMLALAADLVYARKGIVLNPHYKGMGNLYGSEYWTYLLPKRVGATRACELTEALLPISTRAAQQIGLLDDAFEEDVTSFHQHISQLAEELALSPRYAHLLEEKRRARQADEDRKPLQVYREEELREMWLNFFGADRNYHLARKRFVYKGLVPDVVLLGASRPGRVPSSVSPRSVGT